MLPVAVSRRPRPQMRRAPESLRELASMDWMERAPFPRPAVYRVMVWLRARATAGTAADLKRWVVPAGEVAKTPTAGGALAVQVLVELRRLKFWSTVFLPGQVEFDEVMRRGGRDWWRCGWRRKRGSCGADWSSGWA